MEKVKRLLALVLAVIMTVSVFPVSAFAEGEEQEQTELTEQVENNNKTEDEDEGEQVSNVLPSLTMMSIAPSGNNTAYTETEDIVEGGSSVGGNASTTSYNENAGNVTIGVGQTVSVYVDEDALWGYSWEIREGDSVTIANTSGRSQSVTGAKPGKSKVHVHLSKFGSDVTKDIYFTVVPTVEASDVTLAVGAVWNAAEKTKVGVTSTSTVTLPNSSVTASYSVGNSNIAAISSDGKITAKAPGSTTYTVTAKVNGYSSSITKNITVVPGIAATDVTMTLGEQAAASNLVSSVYPANSTLSYASANSSVVAIESGKLVAKSVGKAKITITATSGSNKRVAYATVTVEDISFTASLKADGTTLANGAQISAGSYTNLVAGVSSDDYVSGMPEYKVSWSSGNTNIATINKNTGVITCLNQGNAEFTATITYNGKTYTAKTSAVFTTNVRSVLYTRIGSTSYGDGVAEVSDVTLYDGAPVSFSAVVTEYGEHVSHTISYSSSNSSAIQIDTEGQTAGSAKVTGTAPGASADVIAFCEGKSAVAHVNVKSNIASAGFTNAIVSAGNEIKLYKNDTLSFADYYLVTYYNNTGRKLENKATADGGYDWSVSVIGADNSVVSVDATTGAIHAVGPGVGNIMVSVYDGAGEYISSTLRVVVEESFKELGVPGEQVLNITSATPAPQKDLRSLLTVSYVDEGGNEHTAVPWNSSAVKPTLSWETSNSGIVTVNANGVITAKSQGRANITVTADGRSYNIGIDVQKDGVSAEFSDVIYEFTINYIYASDSKYSGQQAAQPWSGKWQAGSEIDFGGANPAIISPEISGYRASVTEYKEHIDHLTSNVTRVVTYSPTTVKFTAEYIFEKEKANTYEVKGTKECQGITESKVKNYASQYEGYVPDGVDLSLYVEPIYLGKEFEITADGLTVVQVSYQRARYRVSFSLAGGTGADPQYGPWGSTFTVKIPERKGYTFAGWYEDASYTIPATGLVKKDDTSYTGTIDTKDSTYFARWTANTDTAYTVIIWTEKADHTVRGNDITTETPMFSSEGNDYEFFSSFKLTGTTGAKSTVTEAMVKQAHGGKQIDTTNFNFKSLENKEISGDGSTIINALFMRNRYSVRFYTDEGASNEITKLRITGRYGQNVQDQWPTMVGNDWVKGNQASNPTASSWYVGTSPTSASGSTAQMYIGILDKNYYFFEKSQGSGAAYYYVQTLASAKAGTGSTLTDANYALDHTDTGGGSNTTITTDDFYQITGFSRNKLYTGQGNGPYTYDSISGSSYSYNKSKFYYTRNSYSVSIYNGIDVDPDVQTLFYEEPLTNAKAALAVPDESVKPGWEFIGWYNIDQHEAGAEAAAEPVTFDSGTMPANNLFVYGWWKQKTYTLTVVSSAIGEATGFTRVYSGIVPGTKISELGSIYSDIQSYEDPAKTEKYTKFEGWFLLNGTELTKIDVGELEMNSDKEIHASFLDESNVTLKIFHVNEDYKTAGITNLALSGEPQTYTAKNGQTVPVSATKVQSGWYPLQISTAVNLGTEYAKVNPDLEYDESTRTYTYYFKYKMVSEVQYIVSYIDNDTSVLIDSSLINGVSSNPNKKTTTASVITEFAPNVTGYGVVGDVMKTLYNLEADPENNRINFYYSKSVTEAPVEVYDCLQNPDNPSEYIETLRTSNRKKIGDIVSMPEQVSYDHYVYSSFQALVGGNPVNLNSTPLGGSGMVIKLYYNLTSVNYQFRFVEYGGSGATVSAPTAVASAVYSSTQYTAVPTVKGYTPVGYTEGEQVSVILKDENVGKNGLTKEGNTFVKYLYFAPTLVRISYNVSAFDGTGKRLTGTGGNQVSLAAESNLKSNGTAAGSTAIEAAGYEFKGWYTDQACTTAAVGTAKSYKPSKVTIYGSTGVYESASYYAKFVAKPLTVSYSWNWESVKPAGTLYNKLGAATQVTLPTNSTTHYVGTSYSDADTVYPGMELHTRDSYGNNNGKYTFDGWYLNSTKVGASYVMPGTNAVLTGTWTYEEETPEYHTLSFITSGIPSGIVTLEPEQHVKGETVTLTAPDATAKGYKFVEWQSSDVTISSSNTLVMPGSDITVTAKYAPRDDIQYKVNYYLQKADGTYPTQPDATDTLYDGTTGSTLNLGSKSAYTGKYSSQNYKYSSSKSTASQTIAGDGTTEFHLYYSRSTAKVTYAYTGNVPTGASAAPTDSKNYRWGATVTTKSVSTVPAGYDFDGWYLGTEKVGKKFTMPASTAALTGKFTARTDTKYTVEYYGQKLDGSGYELLENATELQGTTDTEATAEEKTFTGFTLDKTVSGTKVKGNIEGDGSLVLKLYYTRNSYKVSYSYTGTVPSDATNIKVAPYVEKSYKYGEAVSVATAASAAGYDFSGWSTTDATVSSGSFTMPAKAVAFSGSFTPRNDTKYTVIYYGKSLTGSYAELEKDETQTGTTGTTATAFEKTFTGFTLDKTVSGTVASGTITGDGKLVLKLYYTRNSYSVSYGYSEAAPAGATDLTKAPYASTTHLYEETVAVAAAASAAGYDFKGWTTTDATVNSGSFTMPAKNVSLSGYFEARDDTKYTVYHYGEKLTGGYEVLKKDTTKTGTTGATANAVAETFTGYSVDLTVSGTVASGTITGDGKLELKLYYKRSSYDVSYAYTGTTPSDATNITVSPYATQSYKYGETVTVAAGATAAGYDFSGWSTTDATVSSGSFKMPAKNVALSGSFTARNDTKYTIEYYWQKLDGTGFDLHEKDETKTGTTGETATIAAGDKKTYTGFTLDTTNANTVLSGTIAGNGSLVLKLYYTRNSHNVSYSYTGDVPAGATPITNYATVAYKYGETVSVSTTSPTAEGYNFSGWSKTGTFTMPDEDVTITGYFTPAGDIKYTVVYMVQTGEDTWEERPEEFKGTTGETVSFPQPYRTIEGFEVDTENPNNVLSDQVKSSGDTVLKLYYKKLFKVTYKYTGTVPAGAPNAPVNNNTYVCGAIDVPVENITAPEGYDFSYWTGTPTVAIADSKFVMPFSDVEFSGEFTPSTDNKYNVEHYLENAEGTYDLKWTELVENATTDSTVNANSALGKENLGTDSDKLYTLNTTKSVSSGTVAPDGGTVLEMYYERKSFSVSYDKEKDKDKYEGTLPDPENLKWGKEYTLPDDSLITPEDGYDFKEWKISYTDKDGKPQTITRAPGEKLEMPPYPVTIEPVFNSYKLTLSKSLAKIVKAAGGEVTGEAISTYAPTLDDVLYYTITVTNSGTAKITGIKILDENAVMEKSSDADAFDLEAGANKSITVTHTVTQADLKAGSITNTAALDLSEFEGPKPELDDKEKEVVKKTDKVDTTIETEKSVDKLNGEAYAAETQVKAGDVITYKITVYNKGNVTIENLVVTDGLSDKGFSFTGSDTIALIEPGKNGSVYGTYTVTEADILAGLVTNTASAKGSPIEYTDPESGEKKIEEPEDDVKLETPTEEVKPASEVKKSLVKIVKKADGTVITGAENLAEAKASLGDVLYYEIKLTNTGNVTLKNVQVEDKLEGFAFDDEIDTVAELAVGKSEKLTGTYTVTEADILAGKGVTNSAEISGMDPINNPKKPEEPFEKPESKPDEINTPTDERNSDLKSTKEVVGVKDAEGKPKATSEKLDLGDVVSYKITVENIGNITVSNITVTDSLTGFEFDGEAGVGDVIASLAPGEKDSVTGTYKVTPDDILAGSVLNTACAQGYVPDPENPEGPPVPSEEPKEENKGKIELPTNEIDSTLTVTKAITGVKDKKGNEKELAKALSLGDEVSYTITVKNDGNVVVYSITVKDYLTGFKFTDSSTIAELEPGDSKDIKGTYTVKESDITEGLVTNSAGAQGKIPNPEYDPEKPEEKPQFIPTEEPDPKNPEDPSIGKIEKETDPVDSTLGVVKDVTQIRKADSEVLTDPAAIAAYKVDLGDVVTYSITVTNKGNVTVKDISVDDYLDGFEFTLGKHTAASLAPEASTVFTGTYEVTDKDIARGFVTNTAGVQGKIENPNYDPEKPEGPENPKEIPTADPEDPSNPNPPKGEKKLETKKADTTMTVSKSITNIKKANGSFVAAGELSSYNVTTGDTIFYTIKVKNEGNVKLSPVVVSDSLSAKGFKFDVSNEISELNPTEEKSVNGSYVVTEADIVSGSVVNVAGAQGKDPDGRPTEEPDLDPESPKENNPAGKNEKKTVAIDPTLSVQMTVEDKVYKLGDKVVFKITVKNEGNVTVKDIKLTSYLDGFKFTADKNEIKELEPGETSSVFTGTYIVTSEDIKNGKIVHKVSAQGKDPAGNPTAGEGSAYGKDAPSIEIPVDTDELRGTLTLNKAGTADINSVSFTITVTNTGNVPVTDILVTDEMLGITNQNIGTLLPGKSWSTTKVYPVTDNDRRVGTVTNTASAEGKYKDRDDKEQDSKAQNTVTVQIPKANGQMTLVKTSHYTGTLEYGKVISYTITATNIGNIDINNITITDSLPGFVFNGANTIAKLTPGQSASVTGTYTVTWNDVKTGSVTNTASASGGSVNGNVTAKATAVSDSVNQTLKYTVRFVNKNTGKEISEAAVKSAKYGSVITMVSEAKGIQPFAYKYGEVDGTGAASFTLDKDGKVITLYYVEMFTLTIRYVDENDTTKNVSKPFVEEYEYGASNFYVTSPDVKGYIPAVKNVWIKDPITSNMTVIVKYALDDGKHETKEWGVVVPGDDNNDFSVEGISRDEVPDDLLNDAHKDCLVPIVATAALLALEFWFEEKRRKYQKQIHELMEKLNGIE